MGKRVQKKGYLYDTEKIKKQTPPAASLDVTLFLDVQILFPKQETKKIKALMSSNKKGNRHLGRETSSYVL